MFIRLIRVASATAPALLYFLILAVIEAPTFGIRVPFLSGLNSYTGFAGKVSLTLGRPFRLLLEPLPAAPALPPSMAVLKPGRSKRQDISKDGITIKSIRVLSLVLWTYRSR
jgi:hypothetical protein